MVAVDETMLKMSGVRLYAWAAIDACSRSWLSGQASTGWAYALVPKDCAQGVQGYACILEDEGSWHPNALRRLRWRHETFLRNKVE